MKESSGYQLILAEGRGEGRAEEAKHLLLLLGEDQLGEPDSATRAAIESIADVQQLEALSRRLLQVKSWRELLGEPRARRGSGRRKKT